MMRRVFVGDIHGCLGALERLLDEVGFQTGDDVLYPVGDLVNKGPDSSGVLRLVRDIGGLPVLGNHDAEWLERGLVTDPSHEAWLRELPIARVFDDVVLIHAGLHPRWKIEDLASLDDEQRSYAINVRYCDADGNRPASDWPPPEPPFLPWDSFYRGERTVVFGHWARRGFDRSERTIALDSGCVYGNALTAWIAEEDRVVQTA